MKATVQNGVLIYKMPCLTIRVMQILKEIGLMGMS